MMILVDPGGHMVSTESEHELHRFAVRLGLKRQWYQCGGRAQRHPHYDLTTARKIQQATCAGAVMVETRQLVRLAWWAQEAER